MEEASVESFPRCSRRIGDSQSAEIVLVHRKFEANVVEQDYNKAPSVCLKLGVISPQYHKSYPSFLVYIFFKG